MIYNSEEIGERFHKAFSGPNLSGPSLSEIYSNIQGIVRNFLGILCSDIPGVMRDAPRAFGCHVSKHISNISI